MADRKDWNAAREAFVKLESRALGLDMTPVAEAIAQARAEGREEALHILALQYHTPETLEEYGTDDLRIIVGEMSADEGGESFDELAARLTGGA